MRTHIFLLLAATLVVARSFAQSAGTKSDSLPISGLKIVGKVVDSSTTKAVEFASVVLLRTTDSAMVSGMYTAPNGTFTFDKVPPGQYLVRVTFMGYNKLERGIKTVPGRSTFTVGTMRLQTSGQTLAAVEVKAEKPAFSMQIDRQVFDAGSILTADGGTATDILKNVPSVDVDIDDNLTMRGKSVTVYVDGKPSPFGDAKTALQMIPAESVDRVELITNPSAKFEAQGGGGIINIVLKKDKAIGYNVMLNAGIDSRGQLNGSTNASLRLKRYNFFGNINGRNNQSYGSGFSKRQNLVPDNAGTSFFTQQSNNTNKDGGGGGRLGFDYYLDDRNTFTISQGINKNFSSNEDNIQLQYLDLHQSALRSGVRKNSSDNKSHNYNTNFNYKHTFDKPNQELTAYVSYSTNGSNNNSNYRTQYQMAGAPDPDPPGLQQNRSENGNRFWNIQSDYTSPMGKKGKLEAGVKGTMRMIENDYNAMVYDYDTESYQKSNSLSNTYNYEEDIFGAYLNFANAIGNLGYQVGARAEQSFLKGYSYTKDTTVDNRFFNIFPSIFLKYNLPNDRNKSLVFNYSTRIDRPNFDQLLPYINNSDPQNIRIGNPELQPALTHKFEMNYAVYFPASNNFLSTGVYYSQTNDNIERISTLDTISGITTTLPQNLSKSKDLGGNFTYRIRLYKWWNVTTNLNLQYTQMSGSTIASLNNENLSYGFNVNTNLRLPAKFSVQLNGKYRSPRVLPQGTFKAMNGMDIGMRKEMLKNNALAVSVNISDVLNTQQFNSHYVTPNFIQDYDRKRVTRFVRVNVRYRFGKMDPNLFRKKKHEKEEEEDPEKEKEKPKPNGNERL
jgi:iron complex outermembrane receptor protein